MLAHIWSGRKTKNLNSGIKRKRIDYEDVDQADEYNSNDEENFIHNIFTRDNHIYFSDNITPTTAFLLNKELRKLDIHLQKDAITSKRELIIYLHLTTTGGCISSAFSIIDCMENLTVPVYTVIDGNVSSAGTLISIHGSKRYICKNSYILIHELRSGFWGKMSYLEENYENCKKIHNHIIDMYTAKTKMTKQKIINLLKKDLELNAEEAITIGLADEIYIGL